MPLDYTLPFRQQPAIPDLTGMIRNFSDMRTIADQRKLRNRQEKTRDRLGELYGRTGGNLREMAQMIGPEDAQTAFDLTDMATREDKRKLEERRNQAGIMSNIANKYMQLDPQKKVEGFNSLRSFMRNQGIQEPQSWMDKTKYDQDVENTLQNFSSMSPDAGGQFAETKMQKYVDDQGFMRTFNPSTGITKYARDPQGNKVKGQETYRYVETPDGFVPLSTKKPPVSEPKPIPGVVPAGKAQREYAVKKATLDVQKLQLGIDKAAMEASQGGQFKPSQYQASAFGLRMMDSDEQLNKLKKAGSDFSKMKYAVVNNLPNAVKSAEAQQLAQSMRNFINANLRRESGAAIADSEFENAEKQYFPRPGDSPEVLEFKKTNRRRQIAAMRAEAGGSWNEVQNRYNEIYNPVKKSNSKVSPKSSSQLNQSDMDLLNEYGVE